MEVDPQAARNNDKLWEDAHSFFYRELLLLASGVQMAGPRLTPATFAAGLHRTRFPNPSHPIMAGAVGFGDDFSMTDDATQLWWSSSQPGPYNEGVGAWCYVDGGARYRSGTWPAGSAGLFRPPCD